MFQNIPIDDYNEEINVEDVLKKEKFKNIIKTIFSKQNIIVYIIAFMLSVVSFGQAKVPFGLIIVAALASNLAPVGFTFVITCIGTGIGLGKEYLLTYILTSLIFFCSTLVFKRNIGEEFSNEKIKFGKNLIFSILIVQICKLIFTTFMLYDLLSGIMMALTSYVFYKVFAGSIATIREYGNKQAFTIEEIIGASLMVGVALVSLKGISVYGFSIMNIFSIFIVLLLGWKNGMLVGTTAGATIGLVLGIINISNPMMIATYTISGMIAGILNKFGKIGVIIGFVLGNAILSYVSNGNIEIIIHIREILIASLALLVVPKNVNINIEDIIPKKLYLPVSIGVLEESKGTINKLNTISETITDLAGSYKEGIKDEKLFEVNDENIEKFELELDNNTQELANNIIYEEIFKKDVIKSLLLELMNEDRVTSQKIIAILEKNGSYIIGEDNNTKEDIEKMVKAINYTYRVNKIQFSYNKKMRESKKNISNDLENVSKFVSSLANDLRKNNDSKFIVEQKEITTLLAQKEMNVKNIDIKQDEAGKKYVTVTINKSEECEGKCLTNVKRILKKVLDEKVVIQKYECGIKENSDICTLKFVSEDNLKLELGISKTKKDGSSVSGDSSLQAKLQDGKYLLAISDGMGSGPIARKSSQIAIKMLERLLDSGFNKKTSIDLINSTILNNSEETFATLDIAILDLYKGNIESIKSGAMPTYIKRGKELLKIKSNTLPAGATERTDLDVFDMDLLSGDIIIMCSDGIVESNDEYTNKELWVENILKQMETENVQKIADILLNEAIDNNYGKAKDDMTVIVGKIK